MRRPNPPRQPVPHSIGRADEFDLIDKHLKPFRAFSPASLRSRNAEIRKTQDRFWTITVSPAAEREDRSNHRNDYLADRPLSGHSKRTRRGGLLPDHKRAMFAELLLQDFIDDLPEVEMVYTADDGTIGHRSL